MCCFFGNEKIEVRDTSIFARTIALGHQVIAYHMSIATQREVAMVLPVPVVPRSGDDAITFIDLSGHPDMFSELAGLFVPPSRGMVGAAAQASAALKVHKVGSFEASYVPTRAEFGRLDPRFRMPNVVFDKVPQYVDYGFAVFQLAATSSYVHPMGFTFRTRSSGQLYFPTVHVHDGRFRPTARFDHSLYYQHPGCNEPASTFGPDETSWTQVRSSYEGVADPTRVVIRKKLQGKMPNQDTWITI